jgi:diguanylate cyclase (GGDEF)-like protein
MAFRTSVSKRETPRALAVTGVCFVAITAANALFGPPMGWSVLALNSAVALLLFGCAALSRVGFMKPGAWPWVAMLCAIALVGVGLMQVWRRPDGASFAYVLLIMVAYAPLTLAFIPAGIAGVPLIVGCFVVSREWPPTEATDWVIASLAAVAIGMSMLWLRLRSIDELAALTLEVRRLATRDQLTGTFNRHGLEDRVPEVEGTASRLGEPVFAVFLDIVGLKLINDRYGHAVGDKVIVAVAHAIGASVRSADVVGRWGGDEFVVLGVGVGQDAETFGARVLEQVRLRDIGVRTGPINVSVGTTTAAADALDFGQLIRRADEDMYSRRSVWRAGYLSSREGAGSTADPLR